MAITFKLENEKPSSSLSSPPGSLCCVWSIHRPEGGNPLIPTCVEKKSAPPTSLGCILVVCPRVKCQWPLCNTTPTPRKDETQMAKDLCLGMNVGLPDKKTWDGVVETAALTKTTLQSSCVKGNRDRFMWQDCLELYDGDLYVIMVWVILKHIIPNRNS